VNNDRSRIKMMSPVLVKTSKLESYNEIGNSMKDASWNRIPPYRTPDHISAKGSILERKPPNFKITNRIMKGVSLGETQNLANYQKSTSNQQLSKIYKMNKLQQKVDALEKRLAVRDEELEGLNQETEELSRQRDESVK